MIGSFDESQMSLESSYVHLGDIRSYSWDYCSSSQEVEDPTEPETGDEEIEDYSNTGNETAGDYSGPADPTSYGNGGNWSDTDWNYLSSVNFG